MSTNSWHDKCSSEPGRSADANSPVADRSLWWMLYWIAAATSGNVGQERRNSEMCLHQAMSVDDRLLHLFHRQNLTTHCHQQPRFTVTSRSPSHITTLMPWLQVKYNYFKIMLKSFQCFISHSHIATSYTEIRWFQPLKIRKLFQNYFSDIERVGKYSCAAILTWSNSEIISGKFPRAEIKLFQTDATKAEKILKQFISHVTTAISLLLENHIINVDTGILVSQK